MAGSMVGLVVGSMLGPMVGSMAGSMARAVQASAGSCLLEAFLQYLYLEVFSKRVLRAERRCRSGELLGPLVDTSAAAALQQC